LNRLAVQGALALVVVASLAGRARAAGPEIAEQSAVAGGTGGASTARSGEPGAAFYNPAALADGRGLRVGIGALFAVASLQARNASGAPGLPYDASTLTSPRAVPHAMVSYAYKSFVAGVSVHVPYASSVAWPARWPLRFETVESTVRVLRVAPFVGFRYEWLALAAGPQIDAGNLEVQKATNHVTEEGSAHLLLDGSGFGAQVALFAKPTERLSLGLSYKSRSVLRLKGDADFNVPKVFASGFPDQGVTARFRLPDRIALGGAYDFGHTRLLGDLVYSTWSVNDELKFEFDRAETKPTTVKNAWRDTLAVRAGVEVDATSFLVVRGGAFIDGITGPAAPDETLAPNAPDATRVGVSAGAGLDATRWFGVDLFYSYLGLLERTSRSNDAPLATYTGHAHLLGVGLRFAWGPEPPQNPR
jgi:long-chain fatty acid transport protein